LAAGLALLLGGVATGALLYGRHGAIGVSCDELAMGAGFGVLMIGFLLSLVGRGRGERVVRVAQEHVIGFLLSLVGRGRGERVVRVAQEHGATLPGHAGMTRGGRRRG